jgi:D-3-phosphoglycerate dehydrogenase
MSSIIYAMNKLPTIWFDRPLAENMRDLVHERAHAIWPMSQDSLEGIDKADGVVAGASIRYDQNIYKKTPNLKVVARAGIGFDNLDLEDAMQFGITCCNTPDGPTISTAEQAMALIFAITKGIKTSENKLNRGEGNYWATHNALELHDSKLALVGLGRIASRVANIAKSIGMHVVSYDPFAPAERFQEIQVERASTIEQAVAEADVVSIHAPLSADTHHLVGTKLISSMKNGVYIINTARGALVDDNALLRGLDSGKIRGVAVDVTDPEPLPVGHPMLSRDDVIVTPHVASATSAGGRRIFSMAIEEVLTALSKERPHNILNPSVWPGRNA